MSNITEKKLGFIDIYHGKAKANGSINAPHFEGTLKIEGIQYRFKAWSELREGITNNERFSGHIYQLEKVGE